VENKNHLKNYLIEILSDLEFIEENSVYHPEENVLVHSLQVFELAFDASDDPELWAAALLHDIGKAIDHKRHAEIGADILNNLLSPRIVWLIKHHLDLLKKPKRTRKHLKNTAQLVDLEQLRRWDLQGRKPNKAVFSIAFSVDSLLQYHSQITEQNADSFYTTEGFPITY
jgi:putative nucleotidyltransferase with HDIG domain